jgi:hypothetical protein
VAEVASVRQVAAIIAEGKPGARGAACAQICTESAGGKKKKGKGKKGKGKGKKKRAKAGEL